MNAASTKDILARMPGDKSIMLRAKHGVGKSSIVRQAAVENGMTYFDVRLSQCEVGDIKGLPFLDSEKNVTRFLKPYWWPRDPESRGILFFDELNRASKDVLQAVFEICLDRRLDGEPLPAGWRVVAAINADDDYDVIELDPALLDRWFVIDFDPTPQEWVSWARGAGVNPAVVEFINRNSNLLDPPVGNLEAGRVYQSRRSWTQLSDCMNSMNLLEGDVGVFTQIVKGWVGREIAVMFEKFVTNEFSQIRPDDVIDNYEKFKERVEQSCSDIEVVAALSRSVVAECGTRPANRFKEKQQQNLKKFFMILPHDVASSAWLELLKNDKTKKVVMTWQDDPEFVTHLKKIFNASAAKKV